ncbi:MAG TPA: hypothetical protein EYN70_09095 [Planctomycetaceae bacterium]|nr:hypothetical protein [Planctomycetaceae bacterium]
MWHGCQMQGRMLAPELLAPFREMVFSAATAATLRSHLSSDGYLFLRGVLNADDVSAARREVFGRLSEVGEIQSPVGDGIYTGESQRHDRCADLGDFWQSVSEGPALRRVSHGDRMREVMSTILDEPAHPHDYLFLRPAIPGRSTHLHYDHPFFARGSDRIYTAWTPLGDISLEDGPLVAVEGSSQFEDLITKAQDVDYKSNDTPLVQLMEDPTLLAQQRNTRLLTAEFRAGDLIIFSMKLLHGSLDNRSELGRTRLSCDVRWQPLADPIDPRYCGPDPAGTTGAGYGELNGAKPLNEPWHQR